MKAVVWTKYGSPDGLKIREVAKPAPQEDGILIRVHAVTASTPDTEFRRMKIPGIYAILLRLYVGVLKPVRITVLGTEYAGEVEAVGKGVTRFQPGDAVFGYTGLSMGTYAEYLCLSEKAGGLRGGVMAAKPVNVTYEEAAAIPFGALEALHSIHQAGIRAGQKVLIVGAGGSIGTYTVQLAKHHGAEVTGVDKASKLDMLRSIGADHVIDYAQEDYTRGGQTYDVIFDTINKAPFRRSLQSLNENGALVNANPGLFDRAAADGTNKRVIPWTAGYSVKDLVAVKELVEAGTIKPVIDRRYTLDQIAEAHRYVDSGQKKGNVVVTVLPIF